MASIDRTTTRTWGRSPRSFASGPKDRRGMAGTNIERAGFSIVRPLIAGLARASA